MVERNIAWTEARFMICTKYFPLLSIFHYVHQGIQEQLVMIVLTILSAQSPQENTDGRPDINTFLKCHLGKGSKTMAPTLTLSDLEELPCIESNDQPNVCVGKLNLTYLIVSHPLALSFWAWAFRTSDLLAQFIFHRPERNTNPTKCFWRF